ncbi:carbohydrate ABC transporter permease [Aristaeella lactis]|uniref:Aldouronate transport system permease protein n=1 Tax=Aristaeella lactis TaxID=3046383 RepID=A0AC61PJ64_9FIRM|nr:carbohydrate ABC transporter permease [Aristaeella lactis]SMC41903.1 putative aldouronate transport system permease protein [Aristaeella lactis]
MSVVNETRGFSSRKLHDGMIKSRGRKAGDLVIAGICLVMMIVCLLPMLHVLACSLSSADALVKNEVFIIPKGWNTEAYKTVLTTPKYVRSLGWTAILTVMCTLLSITLTICASYPLIYSELKGGKFINILILFTMYFSAGTIPSYLLLSRLGMLNTPYALIFPNCISVFNVIIMRSFFYGVPDSLKEAAEIDGAGPIRVLVKIYLPLSLPVIATLSLFYAVGRWNGFSDALMYLKKSESEPYWPIQLLLYNVIKNSTQTNEQAAQEGFYANGVSKTIQMATVMFATVPILLVYPWLQRYFVSGVTIGAVKG